MSDSHELPGGGDLITGEAVALDLPAATVAVRVASGLVDVLVQGVLLAIGLAVALTAASEFDEALVPVAGIVSLVTALVALSTAMETFTHGRTLGKLALGLRTVRDDAGPIGFRHAFIRALVGVVETWALTGVPALVCALVHPRGKRLGDLVPAPMWCASGSRSRSCTPQ